MENNRQKPMLCRHIKTDGQPCRAIASRKTGLCSIHGGFKPRLNTSIDPTLSLAHARKYLARLARDTEQGRIDPKVAHCVVHSLRLIIKILEIEKVEKLMAELQMDQNQSRDGLPADYRIED